MMDFIIFIIISIFILAIVWFGLWFNEVKETINKHKLNHFYTKNCKLIKKNESKRKVTYLFLGEDNETKYILRLKKRYLRKKNIPEEFLIENSPKKAYYNHLRSLLQTNEYYIITFGNTDAKKSYILSAKKIEF